MIEYRDGRKVLITPVTEEDVSSLHAGDTIWIDGTLFTGRDSVHSRVVNENIMPPFSLQDMVLFHAGPIIKKKGENYSVVASGPTTSMRMEKLEYRFVEKTGVRILVGKGGMGEETERACRDYGAVHCVFPSGCAVTAAEEILSVEGFTWEDMGMAEMMWKFRVRNFGPLVVSIDTCGRNLFKERKEMLERDRKEAEERIGEEIWFIFRS